MANAKQVLKIAAGEIGYSRWTDPLQGTKYGRAYAKETGSPYFGTNGVPYCAMFVWWVLKQAGQKCPGMPTASCTALLNAAKKAGIVRKNKKDAKPGDVLIFDWDGDGSPDHTGFCELNKGSYPQTIEGNTSSGSSGSQSNGGGVYRRTRSWSSVLAVIAIQYDGSTDDDEKLEVDGSLGTKSNTKMQKQLGTKADGVISSQEKANKSLMPAVVSGAWEFVSNPQGSQCIVQLQTGLNAVGGYGLKIDGIVGKKTITALQKWLRSLGYKKHAINGKLDKTTAYNIQNALNAGYFRKLAA